MVTILFATLTLGTAAASLSGDFEAPHETINLDEPARTRWNTAFKNVIARHGWEHSFGAIMGYLDGIVPHKEWELLDPELRAITAKFSGDFSEEVAGIHQLAVDLGYGPNVTFGQLGFMQLFYEIDNACTSIVARDSNGTIYHSRNLDYSLPGLQNITTTVAFQQGGKTLFHATQYIGYLGVLTASRPGGWSVSVNQRFELNLPVLPVVEALSKGAHSIGMFLRETMTNTSSYSDALTALNDTYLDDPVYLTVGGLHNDEGAILTRSRVGCVDCGASPWPMDDKNWYRLETNFDHWLPVQDGRRTAAHKSMDALNEHTLNSKSLYEVLSKPPVLASDTTYTASMSALLGRHETMVRSHGKATEQQLQHRLAKGRELLNALLHVYRQTTA